MLTIVLSPSNSDIYVESRHFCAIPGSKFNGHPDAAAGAEEILKQKYNNLVGFKMWNISYSKV